MARPASKPPARSPSRGTTARPEPETLSISGLSGVRRLAVYSAVAVGIAAVVLVVQWPALHAGALCFDDPEYLTDNPLVRAPGVQSAARFLREVLEPSTVHGYYQPLAMISLMLDYAAGGRPDHILPFHRTSLILHVANTLLLATLLYRLFGDLWVAGLVATLFGIHPITVESIVWVADRKTLLATFFALVALLSYTHHVRRRSRWAYGLSIGAFILALLSKPTVTPLPLCLCVLDFWPLNRPWLNAGGKLNHRVILEKVPYLMIAAVSAIITYESQRRTALAVLPGERGSYSILYVLCHNIVYYLRQVVFPMGLSSHHAFPAPMSLSNPPVLAGVVGTVLLLAGIAVSLRWTRALAAGWLFFFIAILPAMGLIGVTDVIAAERYAYWPVVGLLMVAAWALTRLRSRDQTRPLGPHTVAIFAAGTLAAGGLAYVTRDWQQKWETTESLFTYMVQREPNAPAPLVVFAVELSNQNRSAEAIPYLLRAIEAGPRHQAMFYNLGLAYARLRRLDEAAAAYREAIALQPDFADAWTNLGNVLYSKRDLAGARVQYERALQLKPGQADVHYNLANVLGDMNDLAGAVEHYTRALQFKPGHPPATKNLAALYATSTDPAFRQPARAVILAQSVVLASGRTDLNALVILAVAHGANGQPDQAAAIADEAMVLAASRNDPALLEKTRASLSSYLGGGASQNAPNR